MVTVKLAERQSFRSATCETFGIHGLTIRPVIVTQEPCAFSENKTWTRLINIHLTCSECEWVNELISIICIRRVWIRHFRHIVMKLSYKVNRNADNSNVRRAASHISPVEHVPNPYANCLIIPGRFKNLRRYKFFWHAKKSSFSSRRRQIKFDHDVSYRYRDGIDNDEKFA